MVKVGTMQRGWRGKAAGFVYQKGVNGGTVAREIVTPANPQSRGQMYTRVAFGTVAKAAASLVDLIGISFQGKRKIADARRSFVGVNASLMSSSLKGNLASYACAPKDVSALIPNAYQISKGSLANATLGDIQASTDGASFTQTSHTFQLERGVAYTPAQVISIVYGCLPGDQITLVGIGAGVPFDFNEENLQILRDGEMKSLRVVFKSQSELASVDSLTIAAASTPAEVAQQMQEYLVDLFDMSKTFSSLFQLLTISDGYTPVADAGSDTLLDFTWDVETATGGQHFALDYLLGDDVLAVNYFRSNYREQSKIWRFSTSQLVCLPPVYTRDTYDNLSFINYGYTFDLAMSTYVKTSETSSTRYTEAGGSANSLGF